MTNKKSKSFVLAALLLSLVAVNQVKGQVQIFQSGNNLFVFGGTEDNNVGFSNFNNDIRSIKINDYFSNPATSTFHTNVDNLFILLGGGDNYIQTYSTFATSIVAGDLVIQTGAGFDQAKLSGVEVYGDADISLGDGDSFIEIGNTDFTGNLAITTGDGEDVINLGTGWETFYGRVGGDFSVRLGANVDRIWLNRFTCDGRLTIDGQGHDDFIFLTSDSSSNYPGHYNDVNIYGRWGADTIVVEDAILEGDLYIDAANGDDTVQVRSNFDSLLSRFTPMEVAGEVFIQAGRHHDDVLVYKLETDEFVKIGGDGGDDDISITNCIIANHLELDLGVGTDNLVIMTTQTKSAEILGGDGFDTGDQFGSTFGSSQTIAEFEAGNLN